MTCFQKAPKMFALDKYVASIFEQFQVFGNFKRSVPKNLIYVVIVYALVTVESAWADSIGRGTYFVVYVGDDFVVATIDSRETIVNSGLTSYKDGFCKILVLSDHAIFLAGGVYQRSNSNFTFDAYDIARAQYNEQTSPIDLYRLGVGWGSAMAQNIRTIYPDFTTEINNRPDGEVTQGYFISSENNNLSTVKALVQKQGQLPIFIPIVTYLNPNSLTLSGHREILAEFVEDHISRRAGDAIADFNNRIVGLSAPEIWAIKIEMYAKAVTNWSGDSGIGGAIATVILERGQKIRWFHHPSFCPEN